jgi:pimeloyl-ACP methyl ester carboxylesterase
VLLFDLRGQGASGGNTRSFGLLEANDVLGAVRYLKNFQPQASYYIFALGISDGASAVIAAAARDERIRAVVVDSVHAQLGSLPDKLKRFLPWPADVYVHKATLLFASAILGRNLFHEPDINNKIAQISPRPVLIFHGAADKISDPKSAEKLYATAKKPKKLCMVPSAGHAQVLLYTRERYINEISEAFALGMLD